MKPLILIVDDSAFVRRIYSNFLKESGYDVITASNGIEGLRLIFEKLPDLVVLDVTMPYLNGYHVSRIIKHDPVTCNIPIIMFTAKDTPVDKFWGIHTGADLYLTKEVEPKQLLEKINELLVDRRVRKDKELISKPIGEVTDIVERLNSLLDKEFKQLIFIDKLSEIGNNIIDLNTTLISLLRLLKEILDFDIAAICVEKDNKTICYIYSEILKIVKDDIIRLIERSFGRGGLSESIEKMVILHSDNEALKEIEPSNIERLPLFTYSKNIKDSCRLYFWFCGKSIGRIRDDIRKDIESLLSFSSIIIQNSMMFNEIKELSIKDPLTGLFNRRYFLEYAEKEFHKAKRYNTDFSILMIDIDRFKSINDRYGHLAGDECLKSLSSLLETNVRVTDIVARYGGEEFIILAPETDISKAYSMGERIRRLVEAGELYFDKKIIRYTISIGISEFKAGDRNIMAVIDRADKALYRAKKSGRNRVLMYR